jgi:3-deoxy-manno-octulosonate cytidylyltransferase (CMP-KDO synthetase)
MSKVIGIIPARFASSRFPGKPLVSILGKTLIQRTYENAMKCSSLDSIIVATDDQRIYDHVEEFGGNVVMTSLACPTGTDRLAEVLRTLSANVNADIIINIQGDEPCLNPDLIAHAAAILLEDPTVPMSTLITPIRTEEEILSPSVVKCVVDKNGYALYFSRSLIPGGKHQSWQQNTVYYKHLGIYGYRRDFLLHYAELPSTSLQMAEDLEQLKALEHGYRIKTRVVEGESMDVNIPEDIKKLEKLLCKQNISL